MRSVLIPNTSLRVSRFCFGAGSFGTSVKGNQTDKLLDKFIEAGGNFFDTAHCYAFWKSNGLGASERELGVSLKRIGAWDGAIIATKGGHPDGGVDYPRPLDFLSELIIHSDIDDSLNRLQTNCIDLFYLHRDDGITPVKEIIERLNRQIALGRISEIGASNWSVARMKEANEYAAQSGLKGFVVSQVQWSLSLPDWSVSRDPTMRNVRVEEIEWHSQTGIPIAAYSATGNGFFSKICSTENAINLSRWEKVQQISKKLGCSPSQLALAWLLHQKPMVFPVFSTSSLEHLIEIVATDKLEIMQEIIYEIEKV